jgi:hypothetical protein
LPMSTRERFRQQRAGQIELCALTQSFRVPQSFERLVSRHDQ